MKVNWLGILGCFVALFGFPMLVAQGTSSIGIGMVLCLVGGLMVVGALIGQFLVSEDGDGMSLRHIALMFIFLVVPGCMALFRT